MKFQTFIKDIIGNICWEFPWICSPLAWMTARHLEGMFLISLPGRGLPVEVRRWVMNDNAAVKDVQINRKTLNSFITYQIVKFRQGLDVQEHRGGNGRPWISMQKRRQVLKLAINKETPGLRTIAQKTGVSYSSARRILHQSNATPYHKYKTQKLGENHKARRVWPRIHSSLSGCTWSCFP